MQVTEATIHRIQKVAHTSGEGSATTQIREGDLPIDDTLLTVSRDLLALYNRSSDSQGTFGNDRDVHIFPQRLAAYLAEDLDLQAFSEATINLIVAQMERSRLANGGHALFLRYREPPNDFLLIAMLKLKPGAGIDEDTLELLPTLNIDLNLLNEAARINITRLQASTEPYLTFIKGAKKAAEVTEYFRAALACTNFTVAAEQTRQLIAAVDDFVAQREDLAGDDEKQAEKHDARRRLYDCLRQNSEEVTLTTVAAVVFPQHREEFETFAIVTDAGERKYPFNLRFRPDKRIVQTLKRISASMGSIRVSFDVSDVAAGVVSYDPRQNALIILNPSDKLKQEIQEYEGDAAD